MRPQCIGALEALESLSLALCRPLPPLSIMADEQRDLYWAWRPKLNSKGPLLLRRPDYNVCRPSGRRQACRAEAATVDASWRNW